MFKRENKNQINYLTQGFPLSDLTHYFQICGLKDFIQLNVIDNCNTCK